MSDEQGSWCARVIAEVLRVLHLLAHGECFSLNPKQAVRTPVRRTCAVLTIGTAGCAGFITISPHRPSIRAPLISRATDSHCQFPSVPVFKGNLPKVETDPEKSSSPSLEPEKKKAKPRAKKTAPTTSAAQSRYPGLKSPTVSPPAPTAALGLPSPAITSYQPVVIPNTAPPSILYGGAASTGVLRSPNMAYGVPFGLSSSQPVRPVGSLGLYISPSLDVLGQRPSKEQAGKNEG